MKNYIAKRIKRVGKPMMGSLYIHKSAIDTLTNEEKQLIDKKIKFISKAFKFDIIKINLKKQEVSFIQSNDWDVIPEPTVGEIQTVKSDNSIISRKASSQIYHHKWMFVKESYPGFNVKESMKRSEYWMNHPDIIKLINNPDEKFFSKIGYKKYWEEKVCSIIDNNDNKNL